MLDAFKETDDFETSQEFPECPFSYLNPKDNIRGESGIISIGWSLPGKSQKHRGVTGVRGAGWRQR